MGLMQYVKTHIKLRKIQEAYKTKSSIFKLAIIG